MSRIESTAEANLVDTKLCAVHNGAGPGRVHHGNLLEGFNGRLALAPLAKNLTLHEVPSGQPIPGFPDLQEKIEVFQSLIVIPVLEAGLGQLEGAMAQAPVNLGPQLGR